MKTRSVKPEQILSCVNDAVSLDILADILAFSYETDVPETREILIDVPEDTRGVPDGIQLDIQLPSMVAIALFHNLVLPLGNPDLSHPDDLSIGRLSRFAEGGLLKLRAKRDNSVPEETLIISGYSIPGYEEVSQIRFVTETSKVHDSYL